LGPAPELLRIQNHNDARGYLHTCVRSGLPAILVIEQDGVWHAVAMIGMKIRLRHEPFVVEDGGDDLAGDLLALYVHDDRLGPYKRAKLVNSRRYDHSQLAITHMDTPLGPSDEWKLLLNIQTHSQEDPGPG